MNFPLNNIYSRKIAIILFAIIFIVLLVFLFKAGSRNPKPPNINLTVWGVFDEDKGIKDIIDLYERARPNVKISYKKIDKNVYDDALLNALAAGKGPDVFMIHNHNLPKYIDKIVPADNKQINLVRVKKLFPTIIEENFTKNNNIYALPLYLDSLALIYNRNLFDQASIVYPPKEWSEFQAVVPSLKSIGRNGEIKRAAAAFGGSLKSMKTAVDIVELLMMQSGANMTDKNLTRAAFAGNVNGKYPGLEAFNFYLRFSNPLYESYTWNDNQGSAMDAFSSGKVAMIFGYKSDINDIREKNPFLNFEVADMPQLNSEDKISYADYWGFGVSKHSRISNWAWDFIVYTTTNSNVISNYLSKSGLPPALRSDIKNNLNSPEYSVFARQALTSRDWYHADEKKVKNIFNYAIRSVLNGSLSPKEALYKAQNDISLLMREKSF